MDMMLMLFVLPIAATICAGWCMVTDRHTPGSEKTKHATLLYGRRQVCLTDYLTQGVHPKSFARVTVSKS
jgi:hypothetical protein